MLKKLILGIVLNAAALYGVIYILPEIKYTGGMLFFAVGGVTMGLINSIIKPLLKLLTLPLHIITMGLSLIILNGAIFWIFKIGLDTLAIEGISLTVPNIKTYFLAGVLFGLINWIEHLVIRKV